MISLSVKIWGSWKQAAQCFGTDSRGSSRIGIPSITMSHASGRFARIAQSVIFPGRDNLYDGVYSIALGLLVILLFSPHRTSSCNLSITELKNTLRISVHLQLWSRTAYFEPACTGTCSFLCTDARCSGQAFVFFGNLMQMTYQIISPIFQVLSNEQSLQMT